MIYSLKEFYQHRGAVYHQNLANELIRMNNDLEDNEYFNWKILIPKAYARMESTKRLRPEEVESVEHYTIYITKQIGTVHNRRDCFLYCKFPGSDRMYRIILHMDGGVSYEKLEHKYMLRETDELDRRIVLGFCIMYQHSLKDFCYSDSRKPDWWMLSNASSYTCKMMPKRLKTGSDGNYFNYPDLKPYEENTIFRNVAMI